MNIQELIKKIEQWAIDRGLDKSGTVEGQMIKTAEENAELIIGISKDNKELIKDSIGDVFVTLVIGNMLDEKHDIGKIAEEATVIFGIENKKKKIKKGKYYLIKILNANINQIMNGVIWTTYERGYKKTYLQDFINILVSICLENDLTLVECIEFAYEEIANRRGKVINGNFVKEEDL